MGSADGDGWSFATAREPARFAAAVDPQSPDMEHAMGPAGTLCGIPAENVEVYRHLFEPDLSSGCPRCREQCAAAPTQPCAQERLHDRVLTAAAGPLRDELIDALRRGADVRLWIDGPGFSLAEHYASLDQIVEGAERIEAALHTSAPTSLARVAAGPWQLIVVLPAGGSPVIARATTPPTSSNRPPRHPPTRRR